MLYGFKDSQAFRDLVDQRLHHMPPSRFGYYPPTRHNSNAEHNSCSLCGGLHTHDYFAALYKASLAIQTARNPDMIVTGLSAPE